MSVKWVGVPLRHTKAIPIDCPTFKSQFVPQLYMEMYVIISKASQRWLLHEDVWGVLRMYKAKYILEELVRINTYVRLN